MNILFVLEYYPPHIGGVEIVFKTLADGLASKGNNVTILTQRLKGTKKYELSDNVQIIRIRSLSRYLFTFLAILPSIKLGKNADIIHTTTYNGAFPAKIASFIRKKPSVITVHEILGKRWSLYEGMSHFKAKIHQFLEKSVMLLRFDRYVCVSKSTEKQVLNQGIKKEKCRVVYNGVDYDFFNPKKYNGSEIRKRLGVKNNFVYMFYGRPGISKGLEYLLKSVPEIKKAIPKSKLVAIVSRDKAYKKQYKRMLSIIKKNRLEKDIVVLDPVSRSSLPNYIKAADCIVVPSLNEGFGFTTAESVAMGKPVVCSNTTSLPEVVSGKYVLVKPGSPQGIVEGIKMVHNKKFVKTKLKKFEQDDNIRGYLNVYKELIK